MFPGEAQHRKARSFGERDLVEKAQGGQILRVALALAAQPPGGIREKLQSFHNFRAIVAVMACMQTIIATQPAHPVCFQRQPGRIEPTQPPK